jgi:anion-transporting  ArsA/GET3 family ATPase
LNMDTDRHWLAYLLGRRLVFVMGKGGVGKTTVSIALAMAAARTAKRVLLVEVGDCDAVGRVFDEQELPGSPRPLFENIWGARVNPRAELEAYIHTHVAPAFIARRITRSRLFDYLLDAAPGLKEIMSLGRIWRWVVGKADPLKQRFDLVIVDAPATGHALSLLRLPRQLIAMIRFGPLVAQMKEVLGLLENHKQSCLVLVTLPEELPVNETIEFYPVAANTLNMPVAATFINMVFPAPFTPEEISCIRVMLEETMGSPHDPCRILLETARRDIDQRAVQNIYMDQIRSHGDAGGHLVEIPFCYTNDLSITDIRRISTSWLTTGGSGAIS